MEENRQLKVDVPASMHEWLKIAAVRRRTTLRAIVMQALREFIEREEAGARGSAR
ncbi:MAG: hypothetical protein IMX02_00050 [Limnochordaceae bacterium]|nr:hypothetical protein [Limnochordaceae bacterium]